MTHYHAVLPSLFALAWLATPLAAVAQSAQSETVASGTRVRVRFDCTTKAYGYSGETRASCRTATGTVTSLSADTLMFNTGSAEQSVTPATLNQLSVYAGQGRRTGKGALFGGVAATVVGLVGVAIWAHDNSNLEGDEPFNFKALLAVGAVGALLGAGVGSLIRYDRWRPVPSPWGAGRSDRPTLGFLLTPPLRSRPGLLGLTIGF